jgi:hypothetical protein
VPLFHVSGVHAYFLASYRLQRRMVCMHRWDPEQAARLIDQERLTTVVAPAAMTGDLVGARPVTSTPVWPRCSTCGVGARRGHPSRSVKSAPVLRRPCPGAG